MIEYLLRKRKITLLFFCMLITTGFLSLFQLPRQQSPDVISNEAFITIKYPGASAEKVEQTVTRKVERQIKEIQGIKNISSSSDNGYSYIEVKAKDGADLQQTWDELRKKVQEAEADLPEDAEKPVVSDDLNRNAFYTFNLTTESREQLYSLRETVKTWRDQFRTIPGVTDVSIGGLPAQEVRVEVDMQKLQQYGINWTQVEKALQGENEKVPIGDLSIKGRIYQLRLPASYQLADLKRVIITRSKDGFPVCIQDIGRVYLTTAKIKTYLDHNGRPAIVMGISVEKGIDVPSLQARIDKMLQAQQQSLPVWAKVEPVFSQNKELARLFRDLKQETLIAVIAVLFVCTLGLDFMTALMVAMAIPISMAAGLLFLPPLGITINNMSVYGLIVVLGILVDDAVVVTDNIERRLFVLKESPYAAAVQGAQEVAISILTATTATIFSFGPLLFLRGDSGQFIKPIPIVVSLTMLASMAMSLTVIPIFRYWYENRYRQNPAEGRNPAGLLGPQLSSLTNWYAHKLMPRMLKRPLRTAIFGVLIGILAYGLIPFTPVELFPAADRDELPFVINLPQDSDIEETQRVTKEVEEWMSRQPGVREVMSSAGAKAYLWFGRGTGLNSVSDENAMVMAKLDTTKVNLQETADRWYAEFKQKYPGVDIYPKTLKMGPSVGEPITIHIYGDDIAKLRHISREIKEKVAKVPGVFNIRDNFGIDRYTLEFAVNKALMEQRLVSYHDLSRALQLAGKGLTVSEFDNGQDLMDIRLYAKQPGEDPMMLFQHMTVINMREEQIPLSEITTIKPSFSMQTIPHYNLSRVVTITGDVRNRTATEVMNDITPILNEMKLPAGYGWKNDGETSEQKNIFIEMAKLSIIVFFLIVMQIAMQFYSLRLPILVMSTVFLAVAGGVIGLFVTRTPLGFMSMLGFISLSGIVVRNGIVLIDFIETARKAGTELLPAVIRAGEARLRPILLTSSTAIVGLMPLAFSRDTLFTPLAITIISGLLLATMLTLIVVPSLYIVLTRYKEGIQAKTAQKRLGISTQKDFH